MRQDEAWLLDQVCFVSSISPWTPSLVPDILTLEARDDGCIRGRTGSWGVHWRDEDRHLLIDTPTNCLGPWRSLRGRKSPCIEHVQYREPLSWCDVHEGLYVGEWCCSRSGCFVRDVLPQSGQTYTAIGHRDSCGRQHPPLHTCLTKTKEQPRTQSECNEGTGWPR